MVEEFIDELLAAEGLQAEYEAFLSTLEEVNQEHEEDADEEGDEGRIEGHSEGTRHAGNIALKGLVGPLKGDADAAHCADKPD